MNHVMENRNADQMAQDKRDERDEIETRILRVFGLMFCAAAFASLAGIALWVISVAPAAALAGANFVLPL